MLMLWALISCAEIRAQEIQKVSNDSIALQEVVVKAARVVNKEDGKLIFPSDIQKQRSFSGFSLLGKLALSHIRVDEAGRSISATDHKGEVQIRINGILANMHDVQMLDVASIMSVDYIDSPGVRYGKNIAYVIDIHTRRASSGGSLGFNLTNALTTKLGSNDVYASVNRGKSQLNILYEQTYVDNKASEYNEDAQYLLHDGSEYQISRKIMNGATQNYGNTLQLKYNLADSALYVFQTTLTTDFCNQPYTSNEMWFSESGKPAYPVYRTSKGRTYSLIAEAIYENRLKPFTFSAGTNLNWKYMDNQYLGDVVSENGIRSLGIYGFAQIKGSLGQFKEGTSRLTYVAGFGLSNQSYRQGDEEFSFWLCRPKLTLAYSLTSSFQIRLGSELSQHISQIAMISDTRIRKNSMEWTVGNPSLKPSSRYENWVVFSFSKPRINTDFTLNYRINRHCDLAKYTRTENDQFLYSQTNQPHCNMLYLTNDTRFDIIPDHLIFSVNAGIYRFFNKGDEYSHCYTAYNYGGTLQGYWGKWTVMLYADNGWNFMEGENIGHNPPSLAASASYHMGDFDFTLYMHNPFMAHPKSYSAEIVNALLRKQVCGYDNSEGNLFRIGVAWNINRGKEYRKIQRNINNEERETGILK